MSVTAIQTKIMTTLQGDFSVSPSPFGYILNRWPTEGGTAVPGATPGVWDSSTGKMNNAIVVLEGGDMEAGFGGGFGGRESNPQIIGIVKATDAGKTALNTLDTRIKMHFDFSHLVLVAKDVREFRVLNRLSLEEGSELGYNGMIVCRWILGVVGIDRNMLR